MLFDLSCVAWLVCRVLATSFLGLYVSDYLVMIGYFVVIITAICEIRLLAERGYEDRDAYALLILILMAAGTLLRMNLGFLFPVILVFCARSFDVRKTLFISTLAVGFTVFAVVVCAGIGIVPDTIVDEGSRVRHMLGFTWCLFPSMYLFMLSGCICYLRGTNFTLIEGVLLLVANTLMFLLTDAETSFGLVALLVIAVLALKLPKSGSRRLNWLWIALSWSFVIAFCVSMVLTFLYGYAQNGNLEWLVKLDTMTRGRFSYAYRAITEYGIEPFGVYVPWVGNGLSLYGYNPHAAAYNYVDNMFAHMLLDEGWIYTLCFVWLSTWVMRKALMGHDRILLIAGSTIAAYCIMNDLPMHLHYNLLFLLVAGLYDQEPQIEDCEPQRRFERCARVVGEEESSN